MKRNLVIGGVVIAAIVAIVVTQCGGGKAKTSQSASTRTGSGSMTTAAARDKHVDPLTLQKASLAGTVTDEAKHPVASARVCGDASSPSLSAQAVRDPFCTTADAQGHYVLEGLVPASYTVVASAKPFRPATHHPGGDKNVSRLLLRAGEAKTGVDITLRPGGVEITGTVADVTGGPIAQALVRAASNRGGDPTPPVETDAQGRFSLWTEPGRIGVFASAEGYASGTDWGRAPGSFEILLTPESSLAGTVVDAITNQPVAGVQVSARPTEWGGWDSMDSTTDITDDKGAFRIARLAPGRYNATATSPHGYGRSEGSTLVGLGQQVDGVVVRLHPGVRISGKVMRADKTVCKNGDVSLTEKTRELSPNTRTDPDGEIVADGVLAGTYEVTVECDGALAHDTYDPITVADKDITGLVWEVDAGATLRGRLVTKRGEPVADAYMWSRSVGGAARARMAWGGDRTAPDGTFTLTGLRAGSYRLDVSTDKGNAPTEGWPFEVAANGSVDKELVLDDGGKITGTVVDSTGKPVGAVSVRASPLAAIRGGDTSAKTAPDGSFTIDNIMPGDYRVLAQRGWSAPLRKPGSNDDAKLGERVTVAVGKPASVRIVVETQSGTIKGSVVDVGGAPASDAYIVAARESDAAGAQPQSAVSATRWGGDRKPVITAVDGTFTIGELSPGNYTVRAHIKGGGEAIAEHVPVGTTTKLQIRATGSIVGKVTSPGGDIDELQIELRAPKTGFSRRERFFRTGGAFTLRDLPAGTFTLTASAAAGKKQMEIELAEGENKTGVAIALEALVTITGRVVDAVTKQPVAGIRMIAQLDRGGGFSMRMDSDGKEISGDDGRFTIDRAPSGLVMLRGFPKDFQFSDYVGITTTREVKGTGTVDVGDLVALKRRVKPGDKVGLTGIKFADDPPGTPSDQRTYKVSYIDPQGPAAKSGIEVGDVVISVDGNSIVGGDAMNAWTLMQAPPGTKLTFGLKRGTTVAVVLAAP